MNAACRPSREELRLQVRWTLTTGLVSHKHRPTPHWGHWSRGGHYAHAATAQFSEAGAAASTRALLAGSGQAEWGLGSKGSCAATGGAATRHRASRVGFNLHIAEG